MRRHGAAAILARGGAAGRRLRPHHPRLFGEVRNAVQSCRWRSSPPRLVSVSPEQDFLLVALSGSVLVLMALQPRGAIRTASVRELFTGHQDRCAIGSHHQRIGRVAGLCDPRPSGRWIEPFFPAKRRRRAIEKRSPSSPNA